MSRKPGDVDRRYRWAHEQARAYVASRPKATAADLGKHLESLEEVPAESEIPSDQRLGRWLEALRPRDDSGPWRLESADPEDAKLVLPVLRHDVWMYDPWEPGEAVITTRVAEWIVRLCRVKTELAEPAHVGALSGLARSYAATTTTEAREDLDLLVSFDPWQDKAGRYVRAVELGHVHWRRVPAAMWSSDGIGTAVLGAWSALIMSSPFMTQTGSAPSTAEPTTEGEA